MPVLRPAKLTLADNGVPYSAEYDDVYHSDGGALAQAQQVFIAGNGLPQRWRDKQSFVIVETGFGLGHNFLATWQAWRDDSARCARLHFVSVEKHPMNAVNMEIAHARSGAPSELSAQLLSHWPMLVPGTHRIELDGGRVVLTLLLGNATEALPQCQAKADAIFLDGFSPHHNTDMWSPDVFAALYQLAKPGCSVATWSVSASVRQGLAQAGFVTRKVPGFASKRDMLVGERPGNTPGGGTEPSSAIIIGAGLAGTGVAERLAARGWRLTLVDEAPALAQGASGNLAGAFRPLPSIDDNPMARITRVGFLYALQHLQNLSDAGHPVRWDACGVLHLARNAKQAEKQANVVTALEAPEEFLQWVGEARAAELCGQKVAAGGWWFPRGGWINPPSLCAANLAMAGTAVTTAFGVRAADIERRRADWHVLDEDGHSIAQAEHLILANAHDAARLAGTPWLPLRAARGQVTHLAESACHPPRTVVCGSGYVTPALDGHVPMGATFVVNDLSRELRPEEDDENIDKLSRMLPDLAHEAANAIDGGRASLRPISPDRLPMVGVLDENLWLLSGFGARGLVWGNLCAEVLASVMCDEPAPLEADLVRALCPQRYAPKKA
ncbi:MAG: bifunctional tRNA (5-methylaminomethyl-2-thiouridine)(34)-methyltransferase MnmD/FAD-dependent 5-carboxymethylaminomethyl-2-thiouridine(34) oxidoreductase MnmC [Rhodocyclaceae bacterium]